jgi:hypothetical protein
MNREKVEHLGDLGEHIFLYFAKGNGEGKEGVFELR